jgi:tetratricopeptide (TPR) repeat protein
LLADFLIRNQQNAEAAALAKEHLESTEDPLTLNSAAYLLAEANIDLALAEQKTRKALRILDGQTSAASVSEANARSFEHTSLLTATWDTLGFILMKEEKFDEAHDYLEAAWRNRFNQEVGAHYAQLLEAQGERNAALRIYELIRGLPATPAASTQIDVAACIERLKKAGASSDVGSNATVILQQERVFKMKFTSPCHSFCSATFRLQLAADSPLSLMRVSGEGLLDEAKETIKQLTLPHLVPNHSAGRILRDAVLSCSAGTGMCDFVLMPLGNINAERAGS